MEVANSTSIAKHLLILCCYGSSPYIDYASKGDVKHESTHVLDPTDWIATETSGSLLNASVHPEFLGNYPYLKDVIPPNVALSACDLYNLTFSTNDDERLYENFKGTLSCRCSSKRFGRSCQFETRQALLTDAESSANTLIPTYCLLTVTLIALVAVLSMMIRGCFCDCFGPYRNPFKPAEPEQPLDPAVVNRCLQSVKAHEAKMARKLQNNEHERPLLIPTVSQACAAPYPSSVQPYGPPPIGQQISAAPAPSAPRSCSPPPSYRSRAGSMDSIGQHRPTDM
uniref:EGF-like domain-containing protein n=1 Tax=Steinernema glaseri TaxID=37863 RepID=A0A1I7YZR7_9BILA